MTVRKVPRLAGRIVSRRTRKPQVIRIGPSAEERAASEAAGRCGYCDGEGWLTCDGERGRCLCIGQVCWECSGAVARGG